MKPRVRSVHKNIVISIKPERTSLIKPNKLLASYQIMVRESTLFSSPRITVEFYNQGLFIYKINFKNYYKKYYY